MYIFLLFFSATDALKGEGLQEGVDWLQGMRFHLVSVIAAAG